MIPRTKTGAIGAARLVALGLVLLAGSLVTLSSRGAAAGATPESRAVEGNPAVGGGQTRYPEGQQLYAERCASCHESGAGRAPLRIILANMTPGMIHAALTTGAMQAMGTSLSENQKREVSQFLTGLPMGGQTAAKPSSCDAAHAAFDPGQPPALAGWGIDPAGTHALPSAGLTRANLPRLKLKWAFAFPDSTRARSQPALGGGAVFVGSHGGKVYALDRKTGCTRWTYDARAEVRTAISLSPWSANDKAPRPLLYFGDWKGNVHAVEAFTGKPVWTVRADEHPAAVITAAPLLVGETLYVGVSSLEEASAASPGYRCCTFRGSVVALDAKTGDERWRSWLVDTPQALSGKADAGFGPSGVPVWAGLAFDGKHQRLLIATGDNYSQPATGLSDAIVALDAATGRVAWAHQVLAGDAWNVDCITPQPDQCPEDAGPDYDFGSGPMLVTTAQGRDLVVAANKSGTATAVDAATGALAWEAKLGRGGMIGGTHFGTAAAGGRLFVPIGDQPEPDPAHPTGRPGLNALNPATGRLLWHSAAPDVCAGRALCWRGYTGTASATADMVLIGSDDGHLRIYDAADGTVLWDHDTAVAFTTVNGVTGHGGGISGGAGPVADRGQLFVSSGYGFASKMPGNVLLMFEPE